MTRRACDGPGACAGRTVHIYSKTLITWLRRSNLDQVSSFLCTVAPGSFDCGTSAFGMHDFIMHSTIRYWCGCRTSFHQAESKAERNLLTFTWLLACSSHESFEISHGIGKEA